MSQKQLVKSLSAGAAAVVFALSAAWVQAEPGIAAEDATLVMDAAAAQDVQAKAVQVAFIAHSGPLTSFTLKAYVRPEPEYVGVPIRPYIAAQLTDGSLYFKGSTGWVLLNGTPPSAVGHVRQNGPYLEYTATNAEDVSAYAGAKIYVGYGYTYEDMIQKGLYSHVFTIGQ